MPGPPPKPAGQRRRRNKPASHGAAEPVVHQAGVDAPALGFEAHPLVADLWAALTAGSVEGRYFSAADWQRARIELHYLNEHLSSDGIPGAMAWAQVQSAMNTLLVSPAEKRRLGIELEKRTVDVDEDAAVAQLDAYRARISG